MGSRFCVGEQRHKQRGRPNLPELIDVQAAKLTAWQPRGHSEKDAQSVKSALRLDGLKLVYEIQVLGGQICTTTRSMR